MSRNLPQNLTSYDFLKTAAMVLMIIDHLSYYFFPDMLWLRCLGRLSAPMWLFLIGYARSRDFSARMWIGIFALAFTNFMVGAAVLPLSILATMLVARALLDPMMAYVRKTPSLLYPFSFVFVGMTLVTTSFLEYGSEVMLIVMLGYMVRHGDDLPFDKSQILQFALVAAMVHAFFQAFIFFSLSTPQMLFVVASQVALFVALRHFPAAEYPKLTAAMPRFVTFFFQLCGRRSLELYVLHLILFRFVALGMGVEGLSPFNFHIF